MNTRICQVGRPRVLNEMIYSTLDILNSLFFSVISHLHTSIPNTSPRPPHNPLPLPPPHPNHPPINPPPHLPLLPHAPNKHTHPLHPLLPHLLILIPIPISIPLLILLPPPALPNPHRYPPLPLHPQTTFHLPTPDQEVALDDPRRPIRLDRKKISRYTTSTLSSQHQRPVRSPLPPDESGSSDRKPIQPGRYTERASRCR